MKEVLSIVNMFDPDSKEWGRTAISVVMEGDKIKPSPRYADKMIDYLLAFDGMVFQFHEPSKELGIDPTSYVVYDKNSLEFVPMSKSDFTKMMEI